MITDDDVDMCVHVCDVYFIADNPNYEVFPVFRDGQLTLWTQTKEIVRALLPYSYGGVWPILRVKILIDASREDEINLYF